MLRRHAALLLILAAGPAAFVPGSIATAEDRIAASPIRPGDPRWPMAWISYKKVKSWDEDLADLKAHGVGLLGLDVRGVADANVALERARRSGMKYCIELPEITETRKLVEEAELTPVDALMIGGVYRGKAIDRHLFRFEAKQHEIVIEPPVYARGFAYTRRSGVAGDPRAAEKTEQIGHYFPDMPPPLRAEIVVPLRPFDGRQHLKIVPAAIAPAAAGTRLEIDSVTPDMPLSSETAGRTLYRLTFDLTGLDGAMLDRVGIAVYWPYFGTRQYWIFGAGDVSASASSTQEALRRHVRRILDTWTQAAGGAFPSDLVLAARFGDECFYITGHLNTPAGSYPLWDYSEPAIRAFTERAGPLEYPRTWGFPEIYGVDAYAWWLYTLHEGCARLAGLVREEIARRAPGLLLMRNTTRLGVFHLANDHDGSGQELLAQNLDIVHLDPYPVSKDGYSDVIPTDMSYCAGLARRYHRPLIPWMQAHQYGPGGLIHVSPDEVDRMAGEQWRQGVDAVMWLGYGGTFPKARPESWERAAAFHRRLIASPPPKPKADLAVLRPYTTWALSSDWEGRIRNPADWMLQRLLHVWAVKHGRAYDVFELPPGMTASQSAELLASLKNYKYIVSTEPHDRAWVLGRDTVGTTVAPHEAPAFHERMEQELIERGWLKRE
ncbi:MAG: hypothetical protein ABR915_16235 [Thermoguttaceae bacterium]